MLQQVRLVGGARSGCTGPLTAAPPHAPAPSPHPPACAQVHGDLSACNVLLQSTVSSQKGRGRSSLDTTGRTFMAKVWGQRVWGGSPPGGMGG